METELERDFKGVWIPKEIWLDNKLTWMEKIVITEINSLDGKDGCFASNNYLADFFDLTPGRISQIISSLIDKKYISANYEKKGKEVVKRVLRILNTPIKNSRGGIKNIKEGYLENAKGINTKSNNTISIYREGKFFNITEERHNKYKQLYPKLDIDFQYDKMDIWLEDNPKKQKTDRGYPRFVSGWLDRANNNKQPDTKSTTPTMKNGVLIS